MRFECDQVQRVAWLDHESGGATRTENKWNGDRATGTLVAGFSESMNLAHKKTALESAVFLYQKITSWQALRELQVLRA